MTKTRPGQKTNQRPAFFRGLAAILIVGLGAVTVRSQGAPETPIAIAVFDFELDDVTPASSLLQQTTSTTAALQTSTSPQPARLQDCNGCEADMALNLGAQQSMIGVVRRATQTDYYVGVSIRDASTGKLVNEQAANFAGGEEGWASGVRILLDHQVLYPGQPERLSSSDEPSPAK